MSEASSSLPARPSIEQLRKRAKERLADLRATNPSAKLADAQFAIAREHGFDSWPKLVDHMSTMDPRLAEPQITAPVSRWLGAGDVDRTVDFWRDVLGFEVTERAPDGTVEVRSGRARIHFGELDAAPDFSKEGPPGSAVVFFDTDDVTAMQAAIRRRGGQPSDLENVNWIKRSVFEVRDPDGHVIWFGQSYHQTSPARPHHMMSRIMPAWMANVGHASPVKWATLAFEGAIWRDFSAAEMLLPLGILLAVGIVAFWLGSMRLARRYGP